MNDESESSRHHGYRGLYTLTEEATSKSGWNEVGSHCSSMKMQMVKHRLRAIKP